MPDPDLSRYARQSRFAPLGDEGQRRLAKSRAVICGCGALGTVAAETLVRAGVGHVRIIDRDFVELNNLQRQVLFDEDDVARRLPKAIAAAEKLRRINSQVRVEPFVVDITPGNVLSLLDSRGGKPMNAEPADTEPADTEPADSEPADAELIGAQVIVDGTDNFETRLLLNDAALELGVPWIYAGCLGAEGQTMTIVPGQTGCLRCLLPEPPPAGTMPSCETAGVLGPIVNVIASIAACEAIKILSGRIGAVNPSLTVIDLWTNRVRQLDARALSRSADCPACQRRDFAWLRGERTGHSAVLCGRSAVQVSPPPDAPRVDLAALAERLAPLGQVERNPYLLRVSVNDLQLTVFADGRAIVGGTTDPAVARSAYARYIGI